MVPEGDVRSFAGRHTARELDWPPPPQLTRKVVIPETDAVVGSAESRQPRRCPCCTVGPCRLYYPLLYYPLPPTVSRARAPLCSGLSISVFVCRS